MPCPKPIPRAGRRRPILPECFGSERDSKHSGSIGRRRPALGIGLGHGMSQLHFFMSGAVGFGSWVAGVFFFRFWKRTNDRLFFFFGLAFWLFALGRVLSAVLHTP